MATGGEESPEVENVGWEYDLVNTVEQYDHPILLDTIGTVGSSMETETFVVAKCPTKVVGAPVTSNGDLKYQFVETNVGFDTICKVSTQLISNVCTDALSAEKYYYFIRLMGRKTSHVALECTLQSQPNMVILEEEVAQSKLTLFEISQKISDEIQSLLQQGVAADKIYVHLSPWASALFEFPPPFIRRQLLLYTESDGSAQLSQIQTEKLLAYLVEAEINKCQKEGTYKGKKFNAICQFFGYQARGSLSSKFDSDYAYVLGHICYHILASVLKGYMATVTNLKNPINKWKCGAAPISSMMTVKRWSPNPGAMSIGKPDQSNDSNSRSNSGNKPKVVACAAELSSPYPDYTIGYGVVCHLIASSLVLLASQGPANRNKRNQHPVNNKPNRTTVMPNSIIAHIKSDDDADDAHLELHYVESAFVETILPKRKLY
ncbi:hypothetical protein KIW84_022609 [Lathyrus oleraceus]|uniref:Phosphofructokinase domain-containing protein n=1 Tax=Pisum sativum TaxID=3888 RepID=A0A9D5B6V2_PEA|nr:hypothetical protein KIW84_022609 [Pisum sativum]